MPPMPPRTGGWWLGGWVAGWLAGDHPRAGNSAGHYHWLCSGVEGARGTGSVSRSLVRRLFFSKVSRCKTVKHMHEIHHPTIKDLCA